MTHDAYVCPLCSCFHSGQPFGALCPNYYPLRDALFDCEETSEVIVTDAEARALRWLAGTADRETREALCALFVRARKYAAVRGVR